MDQIGIVVSIQGGVSVHSGSGARDLSAGSPVYAGDQLVTGTDGSVEIQFIDDSVYAQGADTQMTIDEFVYNPENAEANMLFRVTEGTFRMVTGGLADLNPDGVRVESNLSVIGIRGTGFEGSVTPDGEKFGIFMYDHHSVVVQTDTGIGLITQGNHIIEVSPEGTLDMPRPYANFEIDAFQSVPLHSLPALRYDYIRSSAEDGEFDSTHLDRHADEHADTGEEHQEASAEAQESGDADVVAEAAAEEVPTEAPAEELSAQASLAPEAPGDDSAQSENITAETVTAEEYGPAVDLETMVEAALAEEELGGPEEFSASDEGQESENMLSADAKGVKATPEGISTKVGEAETLSAQAEDFFGSGSLNADAGFSGDGLGEEEAQLQSPTELSSHKQERETIEDRLGAEQQAVKDAFEQHLDEVKDAFGRKFDDVSSTFAGAFQSGTSSFPATTANNQSQGDDILERMEQAGQDREELIEELTEVTGDEEEAQKIAETMTEIGQQVREVLLSDISPEEEEGDLNAQADSESEGVTLAEYLNDLRQEAKEEIVDEILADAAVTGATEEREDEGRNDDNNHGNGSESDPSNNGNADNADNEVSFTEESLFEYIYAVHVDPDSASLIAAMSNGDEITADMFGEDYAELFADIDGLESFVSEWRAQNPDAWTELWDHASTMDTSTEFKDAVSELENLLEEYLEEAAEAEEDENETPSNNGNGNADPGTPRYDSILTGSDESDLLIGDADTVFEDIGGTLAGDRSLLDDAVSQALHDSNSPNSKDVLHGGEGNDFLLGGTGKDMFFFSEFGSDHFDNIMDFSHGDVIGLDTSVFEGLDKDNDGKLDDDEFCTNAGPNSNMNFGAGLFYDADGGVLYYNDHGFNPICFIEDFDAETIEADDIELITP